MAYHNWQHQSYEAGALPPHGGLPPLLPAPPPPRPAAAPPPPPTAVCIVRQEAQTAFDLDMIASLGIRTRVAASTAPDLIFIKDGQRLAFLLAPPSIAFPDHFPEAWLDRLAAAARTSPSPPAVLVPLTWASSPSFARLACSAGCGGSSGSSANPRLRAARLCPTVVDPSCSQGATEAALRLAHELLRAGAAPPEASPARAALDEASSAGAAEEVLSAVAAAATMAATRGGGSGSSNQLTVRLGRALAAAPPGPSKSLAGLLRAVAAEGRLPPSSSPGESDSDGEALGAAMRALLLQTKCSWNT